MSLFGDVGGQLKDAAQSVAILVELRQRASDGWMFTLEQISALGGW
jgi:hypothetical protein